MANESFLSLGDEERVAAELIKSVQAIYGTSAQVSLGTTAEPLIPMQLSSRSGGKLKTSDRRAILIDCGAASKNLCAALFVQQESVNKFMMANPIASRTLITQALTGGLFFWFHCDDWVPGETTTSALSWHSTGLIPMAWVDEKPDQRIRRRLPVAETKFADFHWDSESEHVFWVARQISLYGPAVWQAGPRKRVLNDCVICRIFAKDAEVQFDTVAQQFLSKGPSGEFEHFSEEDLMGLLTAWLQNLAPQFGGCFPMTELRLPRLRSMIEQLKVVAAVFEPDPRDGLLSYVKGRLCAQPGANLTTEEIQNDYLQYAKQYQIGRYPRCRFLRQLPKFIDEVFHIVRSHNVRRLNEEKTKMTDRRGFHNLAFRDGADAVDGADGRSQNA